MCWFATGDVKYWKGNFVLIMFVCRYW